MEWALLIFVGLNAPTVVPVATMDHCVSAAAHITVNMKGKHAATLTGLVHTACIPTKGAIPSAEDVGTALTAQRMIEVTAACANSDLSICPDEDTAKLVQERRAAARK